MTASPAQAPMRTLEDLFLLIQHEQARTPSSKVRTMATSRLFLRPAEAQGWFDLVRGSFWSGDGFAQGKREPRAFGALGDLPDSRAGKSFFTLSMTLLTWLTRTFPQETPLMDRESWLGGDHPRSALRDLAADSQLPVGAARDLARFLLRGPESAADLPPAVDARAVRLPVALWSPGQTTGGRVSMLTLWASEALNADADPRPYPALPSAFLPTNDAFREAIDHAWAFATSQSPRLNTLDVRWELQIAPTAGSLRQARIDGASAGAAFAAGLLQLAQEASRSHGHPSWRDASSSP